MVNLIPRAEWTSRPPRSRIHGNLNRPTSGHWNGPEVRVFGAPIWNHNDCFSLVRGIQDYHMDGNGWADIGYNFVDCPHRFCFEGRGLNVINAGNGTNEGNRSSHAVLFLAGDGNPFTDDEKFGFRETVRYISEHTNAPDSAIAHRDHIATACPGDERYQWIHSGMPLPVLEPRGPVLEEDEMKSWLVRSPEGAVFVFDGVVLRPANDPTYRTILRFHGTAGDPWFDWSQEAIDAVPKEAGN